MANAFKRKYRDRNDKLRRVTTYTVEWRDAGGQWHRLPTKYTDKQAAVDLGNRLERESAQGLEGRRDLYAKAKARPLMEHVADWLADLEAKGRSEKYRYNCRNRMAKLAAECPWANLGEITPDSFVKWRTATKGPNQGPETLNQYLETAGAFLGWCIRQKRTPADPLATVGKLDTAKDIRRKRRALTEAQLRRLLETAPAERSLVYRFAAFTGLRRAEIEALRWGDLRLSAVKPYVQLRAEATKARRADRVPIRQDLADLLRTHRPAGAAEVDAVFPEVPDMDTYRADLGAAGIVYKDAQDRQADFHALRTTLGTMLAQSGAAPRVAMEVGLNR